MGDVEAVFADDECLDQPSVVEFDEFPKILLKRTDLESLPVRESFIPGLLNLSEVDQILRGKFKPTFEETSRPEIGECFSNVNASGGKKVIIRCLV